MEEQGFLVGDKVEKVGGDYTFEGIVVAAFKKLSGARRYVVEDDRGVLHVYSDKILRFLDEGDWKSGGRGFDTRRLHQKGLVMIVVNAPITPTGGGRLAVIFEGSLPLRWSFHDGGELDSTDDK